MRKLILLAGLHKTGTTSIQNFASQNINSLKSAGVYYPPFLKYSGQFGTQGTGNHTRFLRCAFKENALHKFKSIDSEPYEVSRQKILQHLNKYIQESKEDRILMSSEAVSNFQPSELMNLKDWFTQRDIDVKVLCCIRKPSSWLQSMVAQRIIGLHGPRLSLEAVLEEFGERGGLLVPRIQNLMQACPNTEFYSFEAATQHPSGVTGYFFEKAGIDLPIGQENLKRNAGKSDHAVRINSLLNELVGPRANSQASTDFYDKLSSRLPALFNVPGNSFRLRQNEVAPLLPLLLKENEWLKEKFGPGFFDEEINFNSNPVSLSPQTRDFLKANFKTVGPRVKQVVKRYLAEH